MGFERLVGTMGAALLLCASMALVSPGCSKKEPETKSKKAKADPLDRALMVPVGGPAMTRPIAPAPERPPDTAEVLYQKARAAWLAGKCENAINLARHANRIKQTARSVGLIGACGCSLSRRATALWAYKLLQGGQRTMLKQVCLSKGIDLDAETADEADMADVAPEDDMSAAGLYSKARSAWLAGQCGKAIRLAQKANKLKHSSRHTSIIGACACTLRRVNLAKWAYRNLRGGNRTMLINVCRSKGIQLN